MRPSNDEFDLTQTALQITLVLTQLLRHADEMMRGISGNPLVSIPIMLSQNTNFSPLIIIFQSKFPERNYYSLLIYIWEAQSSLSGAIPSRSFNIIKMESM